MNPSPDMPQRHREALELLCLVILQEESFRTWFHGLITCPVNIRVSALLQMITQMRHNDEDPELIDAVSTLCDPAFCETVANAVRSVD